MFGILSRKGNEKHIFVNEIQEKKMLKMYT